MKHGEKTFKAKGRITLPNRLKYELMIGQDRENHRANRPDEAFDHFGPPLFSELTATLNPARTRLMQSPE